MLKEWDELPDFMKCDEVQYYYNKLKRKKVSLVLKRAFDIVFSVFLIIILAIPMLIIACLIKIDSKGPIFYRQKRVTTNGKSFFIHKFRTMVADADKIGSTVTVNGDSRVTRIGSKLRNHRIDEFPQVFDVLSGNMSFVGTRPEVTKYVNEYSKEMFATLLLPAGITSKASIMYKDEAKLLDGASDVDNVYIKIVLPNKMKYNLESIENFSFLSDILIIFHTVCAVIGKD